MKRMLRLVSVTLACMIMLSQSVLAQSLIPVGEVIGIEVTDGSVTIAGFDEALGDAARQGGLQIGDRITQIDGNAITSAQDVRYALERAKGNAEVTVLRGGKKKTLDLQPRITPQGPKLGVYLKQGITGVGTVTWYDPETGAFGALGHGVNTPEGAVMNMEQGKVFGASVVTVNKGVAGEPGQLVGALEGTAPVGILTKNTEQGIFGTTPVGWSGRLLPVASAEDIRTGAAVIRSTVRDNTVQEYSVEILKIYPNVGAAGRNMLLKVTDPRLIDATGGIVQGMSGSPIIQDGKLVGAVTHVLVNDPTRGYGIFIENMLEAVE